MIRLVLVDDNPAVREGLRMRLSLEPDLVIVGEAGDGPGGLELVRALKPDVVVLDLAMPGDGAETARVLRRVASRAVIVIHSIHDDMASRERALLSGANAFVPKGAGTDPLLQAIRGAHTAPAP